MNAPSAVAWAPPARRPIKRTQAREVVETGWRAVLRRNGMAYGFLGAGAGVFALDGLTWFLLTR